MCFYSRGNHFSLLVICTIKKEEGAVGVSIASEKNDWTHLEQLGGLCAVQR